MKKTFALIALALFVTAAFADVEVQTFSRVSLVGGLGNMESNSKMDYQTDKRLNEQEFKMVGGLVGAFSKGTEAKTEITRLDKDVVWEIDPKAKTYTESPIMPLTKEELSKAKVETKTSGQAPSSKYRVAKSDIKVDKTGKTKTVNGFPTSEYLVTWSVLLEDTATKEKLNQVMTTDLWTTPLTEDLKKVKAEEDAFNKAYAKKIGTELDQAEMQDLGGAMLTTMYGVDSKEAASGLTKVATEMSKVEGYPIVTEVTWQLKQDSLKKAAVEPEPKEEEEEEKPTIGNMGSFLSNKIAKAALKEPNEPAKQDVLFSSYIEVKSARVIQIPAANFDVPEGYKKVEKK